MQRSLLQGGGGRGGGGGGVNRAFTVYGMSQATSKMYTACRECSGTSPIFTI